MTTTATTTNKKANKTSKAIAVYPFSRDFLPYLTPGLFPGADVRTLAAPNGFALTGKDAGYAENRPETGFTVQPEAALRDLADDILLVPDGEWSDTTRTSIRVPGEEWMPHMHGKCIQFMEAYADAGKEIWCAMHLTDAERDSLAARCAASGAVFAYFHHEPLPSPPTDAPERLYVPEAAVLFAGELSPNTNAFEIALGLHLQFLQNGICSVFLSARETYTVPHARRLPDSLFLPAEDDQRVYDINALIKEIEETAAPDIIVVCLPDALMKFDGQFTNGFGVKPYLVSQAVSADYAVVCVPNEAYNAAFYRTLKDDFLARFGMPVRFFHRSSIRLDMQTSHDRGKLRFYYPTYADARRAAEAVQPELDALPTPVCNVLDGNRDGLYGHVMESLQG